MAIRIKARHGENIGQMLRRFKKLCEKEGLTKDIKRRQYFEKPSERRRRAARKAISRLARLDATKGPGGRPVPQKPTGGRGGRGGRR
ncbi:MAG: 30S ribosomal protein S21 [Phycisphaerales bacterium]|nr:30S ribosomal protein S21 [Phycisphaerae bacterium]NNF44199.1 30S ribosomal protein S21 [Phycisphaerales bacterium]NNM26316.1 30S ribosomal protein S21 [Phycisphaerales bacterium]